MLPGSISLQKLTLVRLGKMAAFSITLPGALISSSRRSSIAAISIAHCGLPIVTCWKCQMRPSASTVPIPSGGPPA